MIPVALLVRRPPALEAAPRPTAGEAPPQSGHVASRRRCARRSSSSCWLTNFFCCATHSGPIFHTVSYAVTCGIPMIAAVTIYSVEGLAGMGGRIAFGLLGDRFGAKRVLVAGLLAQAFGALAYVFVRELAAFYAVGGAVRLHLCRHHAALCGAGAREFPAADDGHRDRRHGDGRQPRHGDRAARRRPDLRPFASYAWLYIGSWGIGLGAFLIAMTFRPFPKGATRNPRRCRHNSRRNREPAIAAGRKAPAAIFLERPLLFGPSDVFAPSTGDRP